MSREFGKSPTSKENPSPEDFEEEVLELERAINKTRESIEEYKEEMADISGLETHLKNLEQRLEEARKKVKPH